ncbi:hypothetical protein EVAR_66547_1 [Eumeta japonica]|uniref:Uncharacterized protein n=1 Tax=Eumeta variegata TaxID=151549 RepID=A0A4C2A214_EUMVA|nr:hypothetical protein EVAR_66547_1 [Eumeta japonica]
MYFHGTLIKSDSKITNWPTRRRTGPETSNSTRKFWSVVERDAAFARDHPAGRPRRCGACACRLAASQRAGRRLPAHNRFAPRANCSHARATHLALTKIAYSELRVVGAYARRSAL